MVWSRPGVSDSILSQEVSKLVQGELRTLVTHYFFWKAIGREKVTQNADGLLCCCLCRGCNVQLADEIMLISIISLIFIVAHAPVLSNLIYTKHAQ